jgi:hypothetical protein
VREPADGQPQPPVRHAVDLLESVPLHLRLPDVGNVRLDGFVRLLRQRLLYSRPSDRQTHIIRRAACEKRTIRGRPG